MSALLESGISTNSGKEENSHATDAPTLTELGKTAARSFAVAYLDPWGGRRCEGEIRIPQVSLLAESSGRSSCLEAEFPQTSVGRKLVRRNEPTVLAVSAAIGRW